MGTCARSSRIPGTNTAEEIEALLPWGDGKDNNDNGNTLICYRPLFYPHL